MIRRGVYLLLLLGSLCGCGVVLPYDEALFRQGLDQLPASQLPQPFVELQRSYPQSPWARRAKSIASILEQSQKQQADLKQLQKVNDRCRSERDRLDQQIRRLKELTIEMELKDSPR
ncbi:hypothetical protein DESUT3_12560 [Desulfuromonas versatilis]|uniref:Lipoprotein n=1 Tax=Desulfuromonas versatilis TaxID=2802975 RepID=A0ABN6DVS5_9BACT|nr:hypothetical protein [Desulfuromonas versatilis]BCR04187.1 hypothetical protein DESUT3_12560 [Desulfuromonas versatilis]